MKKNKTSLFVTLAAGVMLAVSPALLAQDKDAKPEGRPPARDGQRGGGDIKARLDKMAEELKLTDAQKTKVEAAMKEQGEKMRGMRDLPQDERRQKFQAAREEFSKKMKDILDKDQYAKFEKIQSERGPGGPGGRRAAGGEQKPDSDKN